ncbi:MAG: hypothetical protein DI547_16595 [Sphingobium sp.]|nr:MAG: hypothetical protein DI547_16595 [Sphingobium sp.]
MLQNYSEDRSGELISPVGANFLKVHKISSKVMHHLWFFSTSGNPYFSERRRDPRTIHLRDGFESRDLLIRKGGRWLLRHRYKNYLYEDQGSGHGKLTISGATLPQSACVALQNSLKPLTEIVEIPKRCLALGLDGRIVSAKCDGDKVSLRFRVDWLELQ